MEQRSRRRKLQIVGVIAVMVVAGLGGLYKWRQWATERELERIRAAGEPITPQDLAALNRVPTGEPNATLAWQKPIQRLVDRELAPYPRDIRLFDKSGQLEPPGEAWQDYDQAKALIQKHPSLYDDIDAAVNTPGECAFLDDFSSGYMTLLEHTQQLRTIQRLLVMRAYVQQRDKSAAGAFASVWGVFMTGEALRREPYLVSQLIRLAIHRSGLEALQHLLPAMNWSDDQLLAFQNMLLELEYKQGLERAFLGERASGLTAFADPTTAGAAKTPPVVYQLWVRDDPLKQMTLMREFIEAAREDWPVPLKLTAKFPSEAERRSDVRAPMGGRWEVPSAIAGESRKLIETTAVGTARARAAAAGIAALRFRRAEGRWPKDFDELVPTWLASAPIDPCTGSELRFLPEAGGLRVYSVGVDDRDDGGVETPTNLNRDLHLLGSPDVVFTVKAK